MSEVHRILLQTDQQFGRRLPPLHVGRLLAELPHAIRAAISMAFRNRSTASGRHPAWLQRAADIRFVDHQGNGESVLFFEAPTLGEAAEEIYQQQPLFPEMRPDPLDTGFDLFGDVVKDVRDLNSDSERFDPSLLRRVTNFRNVFERSPFCEVDLTSRRYSEKSPAKLNPEVVASAKKLLGRTPAPQRVRLVGTLDGLEASTQRFSVLFDTGEKVTGVFPDDKIDTMQGLWRDRVLVLGTAIYRASGRLLRIDADDVRPGRHEAAIFSRLPTPPHERIDVARLHREQGRRSGLAAIMGRWPGDETDEVIEAALKQLS
jgi:hypothetical protein